MATLSNLPNGRRAVQFQLPGRKRTTIRLGKVSKSIAENIRMHIDNLITLAVSGQPLPTQTAVWLRDLPDAMYLKLSNKGLVAPRSNVAPTLLGEWFDKYIVSRKDLKPRSITNVQQCRRVMVKHFGATKDIATITHTDAKNFVRAMPYAKSTISTHIKRAKQVFADAVGDKIIAENPFKGIKAGAQVNPSRMRFIESDAIKRVIDNCPDREWRLIFAMARIGGVRVPSEIRSLRWSDVRWDKGEMTIHSPKTEHHEGREHRVIPIFDELAPYLMDCFEHSTGDDRVITTKTDNLRTRARKIIKRAGLTPWPKLFQNLRASRETELVETVPLHVACAWIGNTADIAAKHYLMIRKHHLEAASQAVRSGAKSGAAIVGHLRTVADTSATGCVTDVGTQLLIPPRVVEPLLNSRGNTVIARKAVQKAVHLRRQRLLARAMVRTGPSPR